MSFRTTVTQIVGGLPNWCMSFRHFLYISTWVATFIVITKGDFASIPDELQDEAQGTFWIWGGLSLWAAPVALLADVLIAKSSTCKYRGMWLRLGSDIAQFISILVYLLLRFYIGDYHIYSTAVTFAALSYVAVLVISDIDQLIHVERLASRLEKTNV